MFATQWQTKHCAVLVLPLNGILVCGSRLSEQPDRASEQKLLCAISMPDLVYDDHIQALPYLVWVAGRGGRKLGGETPVGVEPEPNLGAVALAGGPMGSLGRAGTRGLRPQAVSPLAWTIPAPGSPLPTQPLGEPTQGAEDPTSKGASIH